MTAATALTLYELDTIEPRRLTGRCADGAERDGGTLYHGVVNGSQVALCGAYPGYNSAGWGSYVGQAVTCNKCRRTIALAYKLKSR